MSFHKNLFVFDIETVPDLTAGRNLLGLEGESDEKVEEALKQYHLDITDGRNDFIRQPFHQVVAISFLEAEIHHDDGEGYALKDIRAGGQVGASEKELLQGFFQHLSTLKARLVSFNGRSFDLTVLKYRAMLHGIDAKWLHQSGDKWNSYTSRYSLDWHCDLLEAFSDFGASARIRMHEVCAMLGLPGKLDVDGSQVSDLYKAKKVQEIRDYCELDVLNTYLLYLKYQHHTGVLSKNNYNICIEDMVSFLENNAEKKAHFAEFLNEWLAKSRELDVA